MLNRRALASAALTVLAAVGLGVAAPSAARAEPAAIQANGFVYIQNEYSLKCMDIDAPQIGNWAKARQWHCEGRDSQKWQTVPVDVANGVYTLVNKASRRCLDSTTEDTPASHVIQYDCVPGAPEQEWQIYSIGGGNWQLRNLRNGMCAEVRGHSANAGAYIQNGGCRLPDNKPGRQRFLFIPTN